MLKENKEKKEMSKKSNNQGRAYEYAWINALHQALSDIRKTRIVNNTSLAANKRAWDSIDEEMQKLFVISANSAVDTIIELEPCMSEDDGDELLLESRKDDAGTQGDVRDIVIMRNDIEWEIGLSVKHNHKAVKHSRLSYGLDFGLEWFGIPCSENYWNEVTPIFDMLKSEKNKGTLWSELENKEGDVYVPLLQAFLKEVSRAYSEDPTVAIKMFEYLVGIKDYHKIISRDNKRMTLIQTFNIHGTLNQPSNVKVSAFEVPTVEVPTEILSVRFKKNNNTTVEIYMDNGWAFSFRIHSASDVVQPSLKFDVQFIGVPVSVLKIECKWKSK